jgi:hypothetical protein
MFPSIDCIICDRPGSAELVIEYNVALPPYCGDFDVRYLLTCDNRACLFEAHLHAEVVGCHHDTYPLTRADAEAITGIDLTSEVTA